MSPVVPMKTIRQTLKDTFGYNDNFITQLFHVYADRTQEGMQTDEALKYVFHLDHNYLGDGELSQYYNGKGR